MQKMSQLCSFFVWKNIIVLERLNKEGRTCYEKKGNGTLLLLYWPWDDPSDCCSCFRLDLYNSNYFNWYWMWPISMLKLKQYKKLIADILGMSAF